MLGMKNLTGTRITSMRLIVKKAKHCTENHTQPTSRKPSNRQTAKGIRKPPTRKYFHSGFCIESLEFGMGFVLRAWCLEWVLY
jgi:hypothetical protein